MQQKLIQIEQNLSRTTVEAPDTVKPQQRTMGAMGTTKEYYKIYYLSFLFSWSQGRTQDIFSGGQSRQKPVDPEQNSLV